MFKKIIAPIALGGAVLGGAVLGGVATAGAATAGATTPAPTASTTAPSHAGKGHVKAWLRSHRKELRKAGLEVSAKTIGISPTELRTDLKAGNSIAGVAAQHNVSAQTVVNVLVGVADNQINQAVTAKKLTSAQASAIEAKLPARFTKVVNHTF